MRQIVRRFTIGCVLLAGICAAAPALAQPFTLNEKIKPTEIKVEPYRSGDPKSDGRVYGAVITQTEPEQYFFLQGVSIYSPDYVGVVADDPSSPIKVSLHKETWDQPNISGATSASGKWDAKFKTSSDFGIRVTADRLPAKYAMAVWVGNEVEAPTPSPFTRAPGASKGAAPSGNTWLYALIVLLVVALAAVSFIRFKPARMCLLIGALAGTPLLARTAHAQYDKAVAQMLGDLKQFLQQQESVEKFWQALKGLSANEAMPDDSLRGPSIPSNCVDDGWNLASMNPDCQCMTAAVDKLRKNRQMLEKMRILVANQKTFVDKATALGNSYAQLHTTLGIQWVGIRRHDIDEPYAQFKVISQQKHQQLMEAIRNDLKDISVCEAKLGEPDWYQKFGFMYYEFLYSAYRPSF